MGWPKNKGLRLYFERRDKTWLLVDTSQVNGRGNYDAVGELMEDPDPTDPWTVNTSVSPGHLYSKCRRASWDEMPQVWRGSLSGFISGGPEDHRGLWRVIPKQEMPLLLGTDEDLDRYITREMRT